MNKARLNATKSYVSHIALLLNLLPTIENRDRVCVIYSSIFGAK